MEKLKIRKNRQGVTIPPGFYEKMAWKSGQMIVGMDEVGRGCLAGPVVAAAVILPQNTRYNRLKDSKKMSHKERAIAHAWILKNCIFAVGIVNHRLIDKYNIYNATVIAMKRALSHLIAQTRTAPEIIVVDAVSASFDAITAGKSTTYSFCKGEDLSKSIAAASILAKETRDEIMRNYAQIYAHYGFEMHVGYGTKEHHKNLDLYKPSIIHRNTFLQKYRQKNNLVVQQSLF